MSGARSQVPGVACPFKKYFDGMMIGVQIMHANYPHVLMCNTYLSIDPGQGDFVSGKVELEKATTILETYSAWHNGLSHTHLQLTARLRGCGKH